MPEPWHWSGRIFKVKRSLLPQLCSEQPGSFKGLLPVAHQCEFSTESATFFSLFMFGINLLRTEALLGCGASLGMACMTWAIDFSPKATSQHIYSTETTGYNCVGGESRHKIGQGNKGCFYKSPVIICRKLMLGQMESYSYRISNNNKKQKLNHDFQRSMIKFLFRC